MRDLDSPRAYEVFVFGRFTLFPAERLLKKDGECLAIGGRALELLTVLLERAGEVVSHQELIGRVWPNLTVEHANLRVHIAALRRVLGVDAGSRRYISCVSGRGYCFVAPVRRCSAEECLPRIDVSRSLAPHFPLPARPVRMVGRDETIRTVLTLVLTRRFVSIIGPGGIGKTAVAVSVAYEAIDAFRGAIYFVDLSCLTDPVSPHRRCIGTGMYAAFSRSHRFATCLYETEAASARARQLRADDKSRSTIGRASCGSGAASVHLSDKSRGAAGRRRARPHLELARDSARER